MFDLIALGGGPAWATAALRSESIICSISSEKMRCNMTTWCDAKTAVQVVKSGNRVYLHGRCSTPTPLIEALVAHGEELQDVELLSTLSFGPVPYTDPRWAGHFHVRAIFVGASEREAVNAGRASYAPTFLST